MTTRYKATVHLKPWLRNAAHRTMDAIPLCQPLFPPHLTMHTKSTSSLAMIAAASLLSGCAAAVSWIPGSVATKVEPRREEGKVSLQCQATSSGTCFFLVGETFETTYEVKQGESKNILAPDLALPVCSTHAATFRFNCNKRTTIGPGPTVTYQVSSTT